MPLFVIEYVVKFNFSTHSFYVRLMFGCHLRLIDHCCSLVYKFGTAGWILPVVPVSVMVSMIAVIIPCFLNGTHPICMVSTKYNTDVLVHRS